jgi:hypothetical protein
MPDVTITTGDGVDLAGTLTRPDGAGEGRAVLLLNGSGPLDRDSNIPGQRLDVAETLARALAEAGVASLRFDKRGVGQSGGDYLHTGFDLETSDAAAALTHLRHTPGIDPAGVGLCGHSVGATIAIRLAQSQQPAFAVLLAAAASPGRQVMTWQTGRMAATLPGPDWFLGGLFRRHQARFLRRLDATEGDIINVWRKPHPAGWFREYTAHDPGPGLAAITCPVLAVTGAEDIQIDPGDLDRIRQLVGGRCETAAPAGLSHLLRTTVRGQGLLDYRRQLRRPVDADLVALIVDWCTRTDPMN